MDGATPVKGSTAQKRLSMNFFVSIMVLCARRASHMSKKLRAKPTRKREPQSEEFLKSPVVGRRGGYDWTPACTPPRSPLRARPKEMLMNLSNKAMTLVNRKRTGGAKAAETSEEEEHGVWQRTILMGDKCQPLDFSGVIYYDCHGRQLKDVPPRSPRASPLPSFMTRGYVGSPLNPTSATTESI